MGELGPNFVTTIFLTNQRVLIIRPSSYLTAKQFLALIKKIIMITNFLPFELCG
jgi:hypothetical protein